MRDIYRKRQFFEMAACAMLMGGAASGRSARDVVNRIHEIYDEIETQVPEEKDPRDEVDPK